VNRPDGTLDLLKLHALAAQYGIKAAAYQNLNPGQQRMNIGNRLRLLVPEHVYAPAETSPTAQAPPPAEPHLAAESPSGVAPHLSLLSNLDLLRIQAEAVEQLRLRGVVRTGNAPLGDYAEHLFASAFGWQLTGNSAAGHDAVDGAGLRFQIKARRLTNDSPGERQLSILRALPDRHFDYLASALFRRDFGVHRAALIPYEKVAERARHIRHVNGWRFMLEDQVWSLPGVIDVTAKLTAADEGS
jgi:hypothetical protein